MELKDFYQDEISYLKLLARDFAQKHPELEVFYSPSSNDPDVERVFEANAFLTARLRQKIDDAFPEITHALLDEVWSTPINPIPATTIIEFTPEKNGESYFVATGTRLQNQPTPEMNESYVFQTRRDVNILPLQIIDRKIVHSNEGSQITLTFEWTGSPEKINWDIEPLPLFLGKDRQTAGLLLLWFSQYLKDVQINLSGEFQYCSNQFVKIKPFTSKDLLLSCNNIQYWRLQLLQEYFYTDHVNDFIELDLRHIKSFFHQQSANSFKIVFNFSHVFPFDNIIDENVFLLYCVPAINQFSMVSHPISFDNKFKTPTGFIIKPINAAHELSRIRRVYSPTEAHNLNRGIITEYRPITKFSPTRYPSADSDTFYKVEREYDVQGHIVHKISFFDHQGKPTEISDKKYFLCEFDCINNEEILKLAINDISKPTTDVSSGINFKNITQISKPLLPVISSHAHWPLISHLSLSPIFLNDINVIRQVVQDFDIHSESNRPSHTRLKQFLQGIENVISHPIDRLVKGLPLRGVKMELYINPDFYPDKGEMFRLGLLLGNLFPYCIIDNSFLLTQIINTKTEECWQLPQISGSRKQI